LADLEVVVGDVVVEVLGVLDQPVVGDDLRAGGLRGLDLGGQLRAVSRADDDDLGALGDHGLDLGLLVGNGAGRGSVLHVGLVAGLFQTVGEQVTSENPVLGGLRRQGHPDQGVLREALGVGIGSGVFPLGAS
jgi:hypothetical protein